MPKKPPSRSPRLCPTEPFAAKEHNQQKLMSLREEKEAADTGSDLSNSDLETNNTIVTMSNSASQPKTAIENLNEQLQELRSQLEAATTNAAFESEECIPLQELLSRQPQNTNVFPTISTSALTTSARASTPSMSSTITTTATAIAMSTGTNMLQRTPYFWPSSMFPPPLPQVTTPSCSSYSQRVPTFLPPLNAFQPLSQTTYVPPPSFATQSSCAPVQSRVGSASGRKLYDLPDFTGKPEEWPIFCTAFQESTAMFGYTNVENIFRLQRCINGDARDVAESLLIHPDNVDRVMSALDFRFGHPECLLRSQL